MRSSELSFFGSAGELYSARNVLLYAPAQKKVQNVHLAKAHRKKNVLMDF